MNFGVEKHTEEDNLQEENPLMFEQYNLMVPMDQEVVIFF
jgi:hypothetical protein